jgi:nucleoside-diphosphate-sugar epimerase
LLERVRPQRIYHLVGTFANDWAKDLAANVETSRVLLETVRAMSLSCRILLVGSASEYGEVPPGPVAETAPLRPVSIYGVTKVMQTKLMGYYHRRFGLPVVMARPFNLYGDGCSPALFPGHVEREIAKVKAGEQDKVRVRALSSERDYLPVAEAARTYLRILEHGARGEVYHVGSGRPVRMSDFLAQLLGPHGLTLDDVEIQPTPIGAKPDVPCVFADIRKFSALPA